MKSIKDFKKIVVFDCETTGVDFKESKIIEFAMIILEMKDGKFQKVSEHDWFININQSIENIFINKWDKSGRQLSISDLTHITDEMLSNGITEKDLVDKIKFMFSEEDTLINGYNIHFDLNMILAAIKRYYPDFNYTFNDSLVAYDTFTFYKDYFDWSNEKDEYQKDLGHRLDSCVFNLGVQIKNTHRAIDDVLATWECTKIMISKFYKNHQNYYNTFGYNPKYEVSNKINGIKYIPQSTSKSIIY